MEDWTPEAVRKNMAIFLFVIKGITDTKQRFYNLSLNRGKYKEISCANIAKCNREFIFLPVVDRLETRPFN